MTDIENRLRVAMHAAVDDAVPPCDLVGKVMRRHRRHVGLVTGITLLAIACAAVPAAVAVSQGHRPDIGPAHRGSPAPSWSSGPASFRHLPSRFRGLPMPVADLPLPLPLSGSQPAWFSAAAGQRTEPIAGLPFSERGYNLTRIAGGWAAEPYPGAPACCAGPAVPIYYIADGARTATRIGTGYSASAATQTGAVWLTTYRAPRTRIGTASATVKVVTVTGKPLGAAVQLPGGYYIKRAVGPYLLLSRVDQGPLPVTDKLWDPVTRSVVRDFTGVVAASATQIAWQAALNCGKCTLHIGNVMTGATSTVALPANTRAFFGTFTADRRLLAIGMSTSATPGGEVGLARLGVVDASSGRLTVLPGSSVRAVSLDVLTFGWLAGSHRLVASLGDSDGPVQISSWRPGDQHLRVARLVPPPGMWPVLGEPG
ncbi:MAG: hypothetical protein ACTHJW_12235 [Streptosporangiaceae bacterium]